jgi:pimeloyl-ACP methyl ester carboxylesterase
MKMIDVDGVKLNYQEKGNGPTLILIHGIPTDYRAWEEQVDVLSKNFRTISYSRRCAFPNQNKDYASSTVENNEKDLEGLIAQIGGGPVHLIAHSYGGAVAANCALKNPDLVRSLVLIEPWLLTMLLKNPDSKIQNLSFLLRKPSVALSGRKAMKNTLAMYKELDRKNMEKVLQMFLDGLQDQPNTMKQYSSAILEMMRANVGTVGELRTKSPLFTKKEAKRVSQPTLLLTGERSIKILQAIVGELHKSMPNNEMVTIPNAAHMSHIENPKAVNEAMSKFIKGHNN